MTVAPGGNGPERLPERLAERLAERLEGDGEPPVLVAFQGERGAYGHLALERVWGERSEVVPCRSFDDVVLAVESGRAEYAVLPLRNEIIGEIAGVGALIAAAGLQVVGEIRQPVQHCLLAPAGSVLGEVAAVFSHPAALAQCRGFLARHRAMAPREAYDTAGAARDVAARGDRREAAIAAEGCAERYGLQLLARGIGDRDDNATIFAVVQSRGRRPGAPPATGGPRPLRRSPGAG
ncbi:MAG: hypothetical protein AMXMBFR55_09270 [Gemmatimonadota bacterium]